MTRRHLAIAGVLSAGAGLATSELVAALSNARESPVLAVAQRAIDRTPGDLSKPIIDLVGSADKPLAVAVTIVAVLLLGGVAGLCWAARPVLAGLMIAGFAVVGALAVLDGPRGGTAGVVASLSGAAAMGLVLQLLLVRRAVVEDGSRRRFLAWSALVVVASTIVGAAGVLLADRRQRTRDVERAREAVDLPASNVVAPDDVDLGIDQQPRWRTPNRDFYRIDTSLQPPLIDPASWSLRIHGEVERELTITYDDLVTRGLTDAWVTLCCVSNAVGGDLIGNAVWSGVRIADILAEAGPLPGADCLFSTSADGWTCGTPLAELTDGREALLAVAMNGEPLPIRHGFPVRQVVPGLYGYVSATKWVVDWEVTRFAEIEAYWTQRGWSERGPVKTQSRLDLPRSGDDVAAGRQVVAGVAWAQHRGIDRVEVRVDEGRWVRATLGRVPSTDTWVQWSAELDLDEGRRTLEVRATDANGDVQTSLRQGSVPDGATGWHSISVRAG